MVSQDPPRFGAAEVIQIASKLRIDDATFVIGGQATNLWAWFYRDRDPLLASAGPLTSVDIDYFGEPAAAESLAAALGGRVIRPSADDMNTPNTAIVVANINGKELKIDFLNWVLGLRRRELQNGVSIIRAAAEVEGQRYEADIPVMHPVLCLKSRVANMLSPATKRRDPGAWRQLHASVPILAAHIDDALAHGDWAEAHACFRDLFAYLRSVQFGRVCHVELMIDPLSVIQRFQQDERIDVRYRTITMMKMISRIEQDRERRLPQG